MTLTEQRIRMVIGDLIITNTAQAAQLEDAMARIKNLEDEKSKISDLEKEKERTSEPQ